MAKFVIAGKANCPRFARAELLADKLSASLPHFQVHKVVQSESDWPSWVAELCADNGWSHSVSPLVWRELVDRGGKGLYLGGLEQFTDYAAHYYNIEPDTNPELETAIARENLEAYENEQLKLLNAAKPKPLRVCITNASSLVAYHLAQLIALGHVFGPEQQVAIQLYSSEDLSVVEGLRMELQDLASPVLVDVLATSSLREAFNSVAAAFILDFTYNGLKEEANEAVVKRYYNYATTIDFCASKEVQVVVSGGFANLGASIVAKFASSISRASIIAAPSLIEQQAKSVVAQKLNVNSADIQQVCVWGCTSGADAVVDLSNTTVKHFKGSVVGPDPFSLPLAKCVFEPEWFDSVFPADIASRHGSLSGYHCQPSGSKASLVEAVGLGRLASHVDNEWSSVGVVSNGECYDIPEGVTFSLPAHYKDGAWRPLTGIALPEQIKEEVMKQARVLKEQLDTALEKLVID